MNFEPAPVAFFAFNRPEHTKRTLAALAANPEAAASDLYVFVDGPRNESERGRVAEVIRISRAQTGFRSVSLSVSASNKGLYRSITEGVTSTLSHSQRVIVAEDDVLTSQYFLSFMNEALERYASEPKVGSIHGYSPPLPGLPDFFFLPGGDCWGWATWADRWLLFRSDASALLNDIVSRRLVADFCRTHGRQSILQLIRRARRRNESWAILWHASLFLAGRCTLHPGKSFVQNIGNDGSGFHAGATSKHRTTMATSYSGLPDVPVIADMDAAEKLSGFLDASGVPLPKTLQEAQVLSHAWLTGTFPRLFR